MKKTVKVVMMRKVSSAKEWLEKAADDTRDWGKAQDAVIEKTITLKKAEFQAIADDLLEDRAIFTENSEIMMVDENRVWHVIKLTCKEIPYELYINTEGYDYARYTGIRVPEEKGGDDYLVNGNMTGASVQISKEKQEGGNDGEGQEGTPNATDDGTPSKKRRKRKTND